MRLPFSLFVILLSAVMAISAPAKPAQGSGGSTATLPHAVIETSMGTCEVELYPNDAPKTVENFIGLAQQKYFDGQRVHRVAKNFVIQAGDDKTKDLKKKAEWGRGGKSIWGREFADELNPNTPSYKAGYLKGVMAMAHKPAPNTNTSQFFIMLQDNLNLPKEYTIFGKIIKGMEVVEKIGQLEVDPVFGPTDGTPKKDVMIKKIRVLKSGAATPKK